VIVPFFFSFFDRKKFQVDRSFSSPFSEGGLGNTITSSSLQKKIANFQFCLHQLEKKKNKQIEQEMRGCH